MRRCALSPSRRRCDNLTNMLIDYVECSLNSLVYHPSSLWRFLLLAHDTTYYANSCSRPPSIPLALHVLHPLPTEPCTAAVENSWQRMLNTLLFRANVGPRRKRKTRTEQIWIFRLVWFACRVGHERELCAAGHTFFFGQTAVTSFGNEA